MATRQKPWQFITFGHQILTKVEAGERLPLPQKLLFRNLIIKGWAQVPFDRPSFPELFADLQTMLEAQGRALSVIGLKKQKNLPSPESLEQQIISLWGDQDYLDWESFTEGVVRVTNCEKSTVEDLRFILSNFFFGKSCLAVVSF